ncbi:MAG: molybdopterin-containing oxidoreductase family protein [Thermoanaerobaculaceae bacterium]
MEGNRGVTRRRFIQTSATAVAGAGIGLSFLEQLSAQTFRPAKGLSTVTNLITCCGICDSVCGMRATIKDGVLAFVEGHPDDLHGAGKLCAKGKSAPAIVYDPDRLKYPMRRTNPEKGLGKDPGWVRISWNEALDLVATKLLETIDRYGRDSILVLSRPKPDIWMRFVNAIGTPNRSDHLDTCYQVQKIVQGKVFGERMFGHDLANSKYILAFGWDMPAKGKNVYTQTVAKGKRKGAKFVFFSPYRSATANLADEYFPIRPGSDLAVVLAMIHVILEEELYNKEFLESFTNFPDYREEILAHFAPYTPEWAEELSDVPAKDIARIAREFAVTRPGIAPSHKKSLGANYSNGASLQHALAILNILNGSIDRPGGLFYQRLPKIPSVDAIYPPPPYPPKNGICVDEKDRHPFVKASGQGMWSTLAHGLLRKYPGKIQMAFSLLYTHMSMPNCKEAAEALATIPFFVVIDPLPNEVTDLADVVLPLATWVEGSDLVPRNYHGLYPQVFVRQPLVPAQYEAKGIGWIAIELGKRTFPEYFKKPDGSWLSMGEILDEKVRRAGLAESFAAFKQAGLWSNPQPFVPKTVFPTPSGKLNIYVQEFADKGFDPLPGWMPKREEPSNEYPFYLVTTIPAVHRRNSTQNNAYLNEIMPTNFVLLHPQTAQELGVRNGEVVRIRSRVGAIQLPVKVSPAIRPDCVLVPHGFGHQSRLLTLAYAKGARDGDLVPSQTMDDILERRDVGGSSCIMDAVVRVEKL